LKTFEVRLHTKSLSTLLTALSLMLAMLFVSSCGADYNEDRPVWSSKCDEPDSRIGRATAEFVETKFPFAVDYDDEANNYTKLREVMKKRGISTSVARQECKKNENGICTITFTCLEKSPFEGGKTDYTLTYHVEGSSVVLRELSSVSRPHGRKVVSRGLIFSWTAFGDHGTTRP
jgi:hypothetical protein